MIARRCSVSAPRPHFAYTSRFEREVVAAGAAGSAVVVPSRLAGSGAWEKVIKGPAAV
jgi:hypothetical protein